MTWFKALTVLLSLFNRLTDYLHDRQLIDAGQAKAIAEMHARQSERVARALQAREAMERALDSDGGVRLRDWDQDRRGPR